MYAQALLFVVMLGKLFRKLFFGQLRTAEFEVEKEKYINLHVIYNELFLVCDSFSIWWKDHGML
jgi:hypothetical protein